MQWKIDGARPLRSEIEKNSHATRHYCFLWDSLLLQNGLLFKEYMKRNGTGYHYQFLTPQKLKNEILHQMHNSVLSGHLGKKKTKDFSGLKCGKILTFGFNNAKCVVLLSHQQKHPGPLLEVCQLVHPGID